MFRLSVCHAISLGFAVQKTAERIEVPLGVKTAGEHCVPPIPDVEGRGKHIQCSLCQITLASCMKSYCSARSREQPRKRFRFVISSRF